MDLPKRKSPRIPGYDYTSANYYFLTICTYKKKCIFGLPGNHNPKGRIAENHILQIPGHYDNVRIEKYVVMPNHIHLILVLENSGLHDVNQIMAQYKSGVSREIEKMGHDGPVWQRSYHDHIIRNQKSFEKIWTYIDTNPLKWKEDCFYVEEGLDPPVE